MELISEEMRLLKMHEWLLDPSATVASERINLARSEDTSRDAVHHLIYTKRGHPSGGFERTLSIFRVLIISGGGTPAFSHIAELCRYIVTEGNDWEAAKPSILLSDPIYDCGKSAYSYFADPIASIRWCNIDRFVAGKRFSSIHDKGEG
ncbi:hypothetical protein KIN20_019865 [Parelaphostrongylus tenuis]|uniref:Uncharacterized protein n=1 Tax=Parelaphostrongylus tenuis TaxID=148309 RepID=A0AAD5MS57_PARTN|nr:hypothetical protein KIN20_019865 [Parelaphostrongylus tenuis]